MGGNDSGAAFAVEPIDSGMDAAIQAAIDAKTKPPGSLGRIEELAMQIARVQRTLTPIARKLSVIVFAADHGIAEDGVSAYPRQVTRQMVANFVGGGAAISVFARLLGADLRVIDAGVAGGPLEVASVVDRRMGEGTANFRISPAMSAARRDMALATGCALGSQAGGEAVACGDMGIGNTSAATLLIHKIEGLPLAPLIGRGTGVDDAGLARKRAALVQAAARTADQLGPLEALSEYGGFEIAMMAGCMIGAAQARKLVLVDGFIATAAALVAVRMAPALAGYCIFAHRSTERGHNLALGALGVRPLLDLDMRLGEGTGAALAWPLLQAACVMLCEMETFTGAGISESA